MTMPSHEALHVQRGVQKFVWVGVLFRLRPSLGMKMRKVLAWVLLLGVLGMAGVSTVQWFQPSPILLADDPKIGGGGG